MSDIGAHAPPVHGQNPYGQPYAQQPYQFNEEERRVMAECRSESFWYRALPASLGAGLLTKYFISRGVLTTGTRFGAVPKIVFAGFIGFIGGRASYLGKCNEKLLKLENSPIADAIRQNRQRRMHGAPAIPPGLPPAGTPQPTFGRDSSKSDDFRGISVSGYQPDDPHVNMDIDTSNVKTVDDWQPVEEESSEEKPKMTTTYEQLRQKNRSSQPIYHSKYAQAPPQAQPPPAQGSSQQWQPLSPPTGRPSQRQTHDDEFPLGRSGKKNKYGDDWE